MKTWKYIAIATSEKPEHVHETMFLKDEIYLVTEQTNPKLRDNFVVVAGKFGNSLGGYRLYERDVLKSDCKKYLRLHDRGHKCEENLQFESEVGSPGKGYFYKCKVCKSSYWTPDKKNFSPASSVDMSAMELSIWDVI